MDIHLRHAASSWCIHVLPLVSRDVAIRLPVCVQQQAEPQPTRSQPQQPRPEPAELWPSLLGAFPPTRLAPRHSGSDEQAALAVAKAAAVKAVAVRSPPCLLSLNFLMTL